VSASAMFAFGMIEKGHFRGEQAALVLGLIALDLLPAWVWSDYVVLPLAAAFIDRVDAAEASRRAHVAFRTNRFRLLLVTNAPSLLVLVAVPTGPLQTSLEKTLGPDTLLTVRATVALVALVAALLLHAAVAVAAYKTATAKAPPS
jgi:hypothetical protein